MSVLHHFERLRRTIFPPARTVAFRPIQAAVLWAVGDVHGCLTALRELEGRILEHEARHGDRVVDVVYLGDYVDRGPDSAGVLDHLIAAPPEGMRRHCLRGNHEVMFARFLDRPSAASAWIDAGGEATLGSYGLNMAPADRHFSARVDMHVPRDHLSFLETLEDGYCWDAPGYPGGKVVFVHAGIDPARPFEGQTPDAVHWIREPFLNASRPDGPFVVHGHSPVSVPDHRADRINVDTGAGRGGVLSAVRLDPRGAVMFVQAGKPAPGGDPFHV